MPAIPGRSIRWRRIAYDRARYRDRHLIENAFCRLKGFRRAATRCERLARNVPSTVVLAAVLAFSI